MKGDRVEVLVDTGNGVQRFEIMATKGGRRLDVSTRTGRVIRTGRFMANRVISMVEYPAG